MLLVGIMVTDVNAQGRGRGQTSGSQTVERDDDRDGRTGRVRGSTGEARGRDRNDDRYEPRTGRRVDSRRGRDWDDDRRYRSDNGPAFCRNGNGHPVHGWEWCKDKGYSRRIYWPGDRRDRWEDRTWKDIIFGDRRDRRRRRDYDYYRRMDRADLEAILGKRVYRRFDDYRRAQRLDDALIGYWVEPSHSRSRVMQIDAGDIPLAFLMDHDGDGRVDAVKVNRLR